MIDVVVATYNRPGGLRRTLAGLASQSGPRFRVIVVDDCSTVAVSDDLSPDEYPFELTIRQTNRNSGPARARNLAVEASTAEFVLFVDDDVIPSPSLVARHLAANMENGPHSVVIGPLAAPPDWQPTPWNRWEAETIATEYVRMIRGVYAPTWRQFFTGNASVRRADFLEAGGFNETFRRAEDIELAYRLYRLGSKFVFEREAIGWHYSHRTLQSWRSIPRQYAWSDLALNDMYPELHWRELVSTERAKRNVLTRQAQRLLSPFSAERVGASLAVAGARLAGAARLHRLASPMLSVAYELEYSHALRAHEGGREFNAPSTASG